ncbi:MAG: methylated-DNA--[protein]-cysteine S-methyltransferase [Bdellovibrionales bacterium]|nr:methylated-DNA--[protein]-cysteine S-methyltransferase [Bdellovibrionales bacterium]
MTYVQKQIKSPVGNLKIVASDKGLAAILWEKMNFKGGPTCEDKTNPILLETERQLIEYFKGERKIFTIELDPIGTEFQQKVWKALQTIPFGETRSYGDLAKQIGKPSASRAVGAANGKNPIAIIIPCHRVIGSSGKLTGFAGGLNVKARLLNFENVATNLKTKAVQYFVKKSAFQDLPTDRALNRERQ